MATPLPARALHTLRGLTETFLARDAAARFDWRLALGSAAGVGLPLIVGLAVGQTGPGVAVALATLLTLLETPEKAPGARARRLLARVALFLAVTALGILVAGRLVPTLLAAAVLSLAVPLPGIGILPLIMMTAATHPQPGIGTAEHLLLFLVGCLWAAGLLMTPFIGGPYGAAGPRTPRPPLPERARRSWTVLRRAAAEGDPKFRYAVRLCTCFTLAYTAVTLLDIPHSNWVLTGILTTLRPSWGETHSRIVKRLGGMVLGCLLTGLLLVLTPQTPVAEALAVTVCAGIARPMRGINYGFWPVFATPMLLLLADFNTRLGWIDVAERLANNICGALLAAATMLLVWPSRERTLVPQRLQLLLLLDAHARFLDRVATVVEFGPPLEREHNKRKAERAAAELASARTRLAQEPGRPTRLLTALDETLDAARRLRELVTVHRPYERAHAALDPGELRLLAARLRRTAAAVVGTPAAPPPPEPSGPAAAADAVARPERALTGAAQALARHALRASGLSHPDTGGECDVLRTDGGGVAHGWPS